MKSEMLSTELDMPQLRQMVLENTERIDRNELMINRMRMESNGQDKCLGEFDRRMKSFHEEFEESMRRSAERMDRIEKLAEASRIENDKRNRELHEQIKETRKLVELTSEQMKETDRRIEESNTQLKEQIEATDRRIEESRKDTEKQIKEMFAETNASIRRVSVELLGVTGHIVEGLVSSSTEKIFRSAGFDIHNSGKNLKRELASGNRQMEVDVMLGNDRMVVPVEVKANFTKRKVNRWLHKMETFKEFFPEYADKEIVAAVAALNYEKDAAEYARNEGLLVIRVNSDDIFSLDLFKREDLRRF